MISNKICGCEDNTCLHWHSYIHFCVCVCFTIFTTSSLTCGELFLPHHLCLLITKLLSLSARSMALLCQDCLFLFFVVGSLFFFFFSHGMLFQPYRFEDVKGKWVCVMLWDKISDFRKYGDLCLKVRNVKTFILSIANFATISIEIILYN